MSLLSLPAELKLSIAELLSPTSSFAFSLTSRDHWSLCWSLIQEHARLTTKYKVINASSSTNAVWDLLNDVLEMPRIGKYVRNLSLPKSRETQWDRRNVPHRFQHLASGTNYELQENLVEKYSAAASDVAWLYEKVPTEIEEEKGMEDVIAAIPEGRDEPIIAILLHHLPDLKTLRFTEHELENVFATTVRRIVCAYGYGSPVTVPFLPFQNLTTVAVSRIFRPGHTIAHCLAQWALFFIGIPSLRTFVGQGMEGGYETEATNGELFWGPFAYRAKSNAKELLFLNSKINITMLADILCDMTALERFGYEGCGGASAMDTHFNVKTVFQTLVECVGHSLEHLVVEHALLDEERICEDLTSVSLRAFQKLRTLRCDWKMIYPETRTTVHIEDLSLDNPGEQEHDLRDGESPIGFDLASSLPESLEALHLFGQYEDEEWSCVDEIVKTTSAQLPNLKSIYVERLSWRRYKREVINIKKTKAGEALPGIRNNPLGELLVEPALFIDDYLALASAS